MRYDIDFNKAVNRLVPPFMRGRKYILFIQSLVYSLQSLNNSFVSYAAETRIEASMTSIIFQLEWYLNRKLKSKLASPNTSIRVYNGAIQGCAVYHKKAYDNCPTLTPRVLIPNSGATVLNTFAFKHFSEQGNEGSYSFRITYPPLANGIDVDTFKNEVRDIVEKYRLSNKTFTIIPA